MKNPSNEKLPTKFYIRNVLKVANNLLGKTLVINRKGKILSGKIVEVEAYDGSCDEAAHTFNGKTKRNEVMFEPGGLLYVYFTYGMYHCANVVTGKKDERTAVLLRALEPVEGIEEMALNRFGKKQITEKQKLNLTSGPGKLCMALGINKSLNGISLIGDEIYILDNKKNPKDKIVTATRIGITKSKELPWRFYIKDNPYISKK
ncbi:MAG: 3-methyladenine DNA glycosylase [Ignavibacteria bacterium GWB2_35_6b]|nr:MAG: 3-methyladenine DNA glycosylase [Ignavibacteria bacterium GWB2_35_6b]